ncbi:NUDIX domain-containing protein [Neisseriaceae bacterium TC5R-5]|nr:NUDIX domain-containing protein [Neisseriaceae bacterium TC5R-5]
MLRLWRKLWRLLTLPVHKAKTTANEVVDACAPKRQRAAIIIIEQQRILLMRRIKPGKDYYVLPGGTVKPGETVAMACVREAEEETGLHVWLGDQLCALEGRRRIEYVFLARRHCGTVQLGGPELCRMQPDNQYLLEWLNQEQLRRAKLKPKSLLPYCLAALQQTDVHGSACQPDGG